MPRRAPGHVAGRVTDAPVNNIDWIPTLLDLAGAAPPPGLDGVSFAAGLQGGDWPERPLYWHFPHYTNQGGRPCGAMRDGDWMLVEHYDEDGAELYDLADDVGQRTDLAAEQPERVRAMRAALAAWRREIGAQEYAPNPDCREEAFRKLYVDVDPSRFDPLHADHDEWSAIHAWRTDMNEAVARKRQP